MKGMLKKIIATFLVMLLILISCGQTFSYAYTIYVRSKRLDGKYYYNDLYNNKYTSKQIWDYAVNNSTVGNYYCLKGYAPIGVDYVEEGLFKEDGFEKTALITDKNKIADFENQTDVNLREQVNVAGHKYNQAGKENSLKALNWLTKNMYLVSSDTSNTEKTLMKNNIKKFIQKYCDSSLKNVNLDLLTEQQIGALQQYIVWNFTNIYSGGNESEYYNVIKSKEDVKRIKAYDIHRMYFTDNTNPSLEFSEDAAKAGYALYVSLMSGAIEYANGTNTETMTFSSNNKFKVTSDTNQRTITAVDGEANTYKVGPIKIESNNLDVLTIHIATNRAEIQSWGIYKNGTNTELLNNQNTNDSTNVVNKLANQTFYIKFKTSEVLTKDPQLTFSYTYTYKAGCSDYSANVFYRKGRQPILEVNKKISSITDHNGITFFYTPPEYEFDLALTKNITNVYRYNSSSNKYEEINIGNSRFIVRDTGAIQTYGTALYIMNKTPITVIPGDIVRYKISVYNEGDTEGYVRQITDYLPKGLEILKVYTNKTDYNKYNYENAHNSSVNVTYNELQDEGTDFNVIRYKFTGNGKKVEIGTESNKAINIYIECKVSDNATVGSNLINVAAITNYGYINEHGQYVKTESEGIDIDSSQRVKGGFANYVSTIIEENMKDKDLSGVDKGKIVEEDDEDFEQLKIGGFDFALRKFITKVYNEEKETVNEYNREPNIYKSTVNAFNKGKTTAVYTHMKNPIKVNIGDTVVYTIRVYNEGFFDGKVGKIRDYLPQGLSLKENSEINTRYKWKKVDGTNDIYIDNTDGNNYDVIKAGKGIEGFKKIIDGTLTENEKFWTDYQVECVVNAGVQNGTILTNVAEITNYGYDSVTINPDETITARYKDCSKDDVDIDSKQNTLITDLQENNKPESTKGYYQYQTGEKNINSANEFKGLQDDDDFENIQVDLDYFDLALRKYITKITRDGEEIELESREPNLNKSSVTALTNKGTAKYYHKKDPVTVQTGDIITYTFRIYNEGFKNGLVKEITDYLPEGLEFVDNTFNTVDNGWQVSTDNNRILKSSKQLIIKASNQKEGYTKLVNGNLQDSEKFWDEIELQCKVTSNINSKVLVNVAEISDYGYMDGNYYIKTSEENIDLDSICNNVFNQNSNNNLESKIEQYYRKNYSIENNNYYTGNEDDDDFESVTVSAMYSGKITLNKTDDKRNSISGAEFMIGHGDIPSDVLPGLIQGTSNTDVIGSLIKNRVRNITSSDSGIDVIEGTKTYQRNDLIAKNNYFYAIVENQSIDGYNNILQDCVIVVLYNINENGDFTLGTTNSDINEVYNKGYVILKENEDKTYSVLSYEDELYDKINVSLNTTTGDVPEIIVTMQNPKLTGAYNFWVKKVDETNKTIKGKDEGLAFTYKREELNEQNEVVRTKNETLKVKNNGFGCYYNIKINSKGEDKIELKEIALEGYENNNYVELEDTIKLILTKDLKNVDGEDIYYIKDISFEDAENLDDPSTTEGIKQIKRKAKLKDGTDVIVRARLNENENTITVVVWNYKVKGSYGLKIEKVGENDDVKLDGVKFKVVDKNDNVIGEEFITGNDGLVTISDNVSVTEEGIDWYDITEIEGKSEYIKLVKPIRVYVKKSINGNKYDIQYSLEPFEDGKENVYEEDKVKLSINDDGIISVIIQNEKIEGKYKLKLRKVVNDEINTPISGIGFEVYKNDELVRTNPLVTNSRGRVDVISTNLVTKETLNDVDEFKVTEINLNNKPYVKLKDPISLYVHKGIEEEKYKVTSVSFKENEAGGKEITKEVELENGTKVNVKAEILSSYILFTIPNEPITGNYGLELLKTKEDEETPIKGIKFTVTKGEGEEAETVVDSQETDENGRIVVVENEGISPENVEDKDVYIIKEDSTNKKYLKIIDDIKVYVTKGIVENSYKATNVSFKETDEDDNEENIASTQVKLIDGTYITVKADIVDGKVLITIPNKEIEGKYSLQIVKTGEADKPLKDVEFKVAEGEALKEIKADKTGEDGKLTVFTDRKITSANLDIQEMFTITEVKTDESYVALPEALKIFVTKGKNEDETVYKVSKVSFEKDKEVTTKDITLSNGKVITASLSIKENLVTLTIPNRKIEGKYDLELIKIDQKDGVSTLSGVTFDIKTMKNNSEVKLYDVNGNEINTKGLTTDKDGKIVIPNVKITEGAKYNFEITETKVPEGFVMLKDKIKLIFNTKVDVQKQTYVLDDVKLTGSAEFEATSNKITIKVQNGQFDLALRKFISGITVREGQKDEKTVQVPNRVPVFKVDDKGNYIYEHSKDTVVVGSQNIVEYTLRVYNEGSISGYAKEIKDDIPEGLEFLTENSTNKKYGWKLLDEKGNEVKEVNKAKYIVTNYLSKENEETKGENLIKAFNTKDYKDGKVKEPNYKEVKVAFKVIIPDVDDRVIINKAQISEDSDEIDEPVTDKDSIPNEWNDGEDDQDIEKVRVQNFDLALRKWVTKAIVIEDGKENVTETGHKAEDDPEEIVKVDIKNSKISNVVVKFEYKIRVTNEGQIAGYVKEISDYIPQGLKFDAADNPNWKEAEGKVVTDELKDKLLAPGESQEVSIVLTWINRKDNLGLKQNVAEISKDENIYGTPDIDSTPDNKVPGEDDIDDAPVMLTIKTGETVTYMGLAIAVIVMIGSGVILIKKYVLK